MGSVRRTDWILNDSLHLSTEIILIYVQVWLLFCEMCLAALWDEKKLIQVEFIIFRVATFLPISINLWQQKYKYLNCGVCRGIAKSCDTFDLLHSQKNTSHCKTQCFVAIHKDEFYEWAVCLLLHYFYLLVLQGPLFWSIRIAVSGQWFGLASDELLKNQTGRIFV